MLLNFRRVYYTGGLNSNTHPSVLGDNGLCRACQLGLKTKIQIKIEQINEAYNWIHTYINLKKNFKMFVSWSDLSAPL